MLLSHAEPALEVLVEPIPLDLPAVLPPRAVARDRLRLAASVLAGLLLHGLILFALEYHRLNDMPPVEEVIPVEVIVEPPPPEQPAAQEPEPAQPEPEAPTQEIDLKPATDAPRASEEDKPEQKPQVEPEKEQPKAADPWGLQTQLPPLEFETPAPKSNLMKGQADRTYSSTVYAMIMEKLSLPDRRKQGLLRVRVTFGVDSAGKIFQPAVIMASGDNNLDGAVLDAVRKAGPLPPPPNGGPIYLRFDLEAQ